jgi:hypothetical protein
MKRIYDIKQLLNYNTTGNHWITLTKKGDGVTPSEVEYSAIIKMVETDTYFISVYTSELEPIAYYSNPLVEDSLTESMLNPTTVQTVVDGYKRIKEKVNLYDDSYNFLLYAPHALPAHKKWYRIRQKDVIPTISSTGFYFYLRITNSSGDIVNSTGDKDLESTQEFKESQAPYGELLHALYDGAPIGEGASSLLDFI